MSFDGSSSVFAGVDEIGGFDPYSREFLYPGVVQDQPSEGVNPVLVHSTTRFYGVFLNEVLTVAPNLDLTLAGRYNDAQIVLEDELGGPVNGQHTFDRFNPSAVCLTSCCSSTAVSRNQPRAHPRRAVLRERRDALQSVEFFRRRSEPEPGRGPYL